MSLKTATLLAVIGISVAICLQILGHIIRFFPEAAGSLYGGAGGVAIGIIFTGVTVIQLIFFVTLYRKQR